MDFERSPSGWISIGAESFEGIDEAELDSFLDRIGNARVVLLGEASHGTSEFYQMRQLITQELIRKKGFTIVSAEADWPDAERIDEYVRLRPGGPARAWQAFTRFPLWMWRNHDVLEFVEWLRGYNEGLPDTARAGFYGLDLYSLYTSLHEIVHYLDGIDPELAGIARRRYACLDPYAPEPERYGSAVAADRYRSCENEVIEMLGDLMQKRLETRHRGDQLFDAEQNARVVASAERYYRTVYQGGADSWNLRDQHMFDTLEALLEHRGPDSKAVVWAHNSHIGDASATQVARTGQINIGHLARQAFGREAYLVGFGMHEGTVAAASDWGGGVEIKRVRPSLHGSIERHCHETGIPRFMLPLRDPVDPKIREVLGETYLERFIGVIYRPQTERQSHYMRVIPSDQYDEYIWFDQTEAVEPLGYARVPELPEGHPFMLTD